jgi:hypothetical protein
MSDDQTSNTAPQRPPHIGRKTEFPPAVAKQKFLDALAKRGIVAVAAKAAHINRETAYRWRAEDTDFKAAWQLALDTASELLENEAWRRAAAGTLKPVYQGGQQVGTIREYSDTLMTFLLKAHNPSRFRENSKVEHAGGVTIRVEHSNDWRGGSRRLAGDEHGL